MQVESMNNKKYSVLFYGTGETATIKVEDLFDYVDNKHQYVKNLKRKDYKEAVMQIELALKTEDNITVEPLDDAATPLTPDISEAKGEKRKRDMADSDSLKEEQAGGQQKPSSSNKSSGSAPAPIVSRSGRQIKVKKYSDDELEMVSNKDSEDEAPVENEGKAPPKRTSTVIETADLPLVRMTHELELKKLIEHGTIMLQYIDLKKITISDQEWEVTDPKLIVLLPAKTCPEKYVGIIYNQDRGRKKAKNVWDRWEQEVAWNKALCERKAKLESGEIKVEDEPGHYILDLAVLGQWERYLKKGALDRSVRQMKYFHTIMDVVKLDRELRMNLGLEDPKPKRAIEALKTLQQMKDFNHIILLKQSYIVDVVKRLRRYVGNVKEWNMSKEALKEFKEDAETIRNLATDVYTHFQSFFVIPQDSNFQRVFDGKKAELKKFTKHLDGDQLFTLWMEPYTKEAFLQQMDVDGNMKKAVKIMRETHEPENKGKSVTSPTLPTSETQPASIPELVPEEPAADNEDSATAPDGDDNEDSATAPDADDNEDSATAQDADDKESQGEIVAEKENSSQVANLSEPQSLLHENETES